MNPTYLIRSAIVVGALALIASLPAAVTQAEEQPTQIMAQSGSASAPLAPSPGEGLNETAAGAVEDTLKACLARIPDDASAGQQMIARESCQRDKADRLPIDAVPGA